MKEKRKKLRITTTHLVLISFLVLILIGSVLLSLPISSKTGSNVGYIDALFTAASASCVTGLTTIPIVGSFSFFGQLVILLLIQVGGLGVITVVAGFVIMITKRFRFKDSRLVGEAFNLNTLSGLGDFVKRTIKGTLLIEGAGALLYMTVFVPEMGVGGIWVSVFNSVSAFCNAGIDVISDTSLIAYATNPLINSVTCLLITLGGVGYIVWWDVIRIFKDVKVKGIKRLKMLTLHSKIVIITTLFLTVVGAG